MDTVNDTIERLDQPPDQYSKMWADLVIGKLNRVISRLNDQVSSQQTQIEQLQAKVNAIS